MMRIWKGTAKKRPSIMEYRSTMPLDGPDESGSQNRRNGVFAFRKTSELQDF
jgi:hypothetical protein